MVCYGLLAPGGLLVASGDLPAGGVPAMVFGDFIAGGAVPVSGAVLHFSMGH